MSNYTSIDSLAEALRALSHPHRLRIFMRLVRCCPSGASCDPPSGEAVAPCVGDLGADLGIVPSTVSHHMKELRRAGLVRMERRGQLVVCQVDEDMLETLARFFADPGVVPEEASTTEESP